MKEAMNSDLVSKYGYSIVADSQGTILCKPESVSMFGDLLAECSEDLPPYKEDFSFMIKDSKIALYLGDLYLLTLSKEEIELILKTLNTIEE